MAKYVVKPHIVEARCLSMNLDEALKVCKWAGGDLYPDGCYVRNIAGQFRARPGDYIVKNKRGEFTVYKPDKFNSTFDLIEED